LVVVSIDRIGRRWLDTIGNIHDLQRRGVRIRSLADNEQSWAHASAGERRPGRLARELVPNLMVHHLRVGGKMDTVSQGTAAFATAT
jgi:hypothetical protein